MTVSPTATAAGHSETAVGRGLLRRLLPQRRSIGELLRHRAVGRLPVRACLRTANPSNSRSSARHLAVGETVILLHPPPSPFSRCFNRDGEGTPAK